MYGASVHMSIGACKYFCLAHGHYGLYGFGMSKDTKSERFEIRLTPEDLAAIDDIRRIEPDIPPRSEMVRRLIHKAVAKQQKRRA